MKKKKLNTNWQERKQMYSYSFNTRSDIVIGHQVTCYFDQ